MKQWNNVCYLDYNHPFSIILIDNYTNYGIKQKPLQVVNDHAFYVQSPNHGVSSIFLVLASLRFLTLK